MEIKIFNQIDPYIHIGSIIPFSLFYYNEEMNNITENDIIVE